MKIITIIIFIDNEKPGDAYGMGKAFANRG
jgi:hypothetical protein